MAKDTDHGFRQWLAKNYPREVFQNRHRLIGSADSFDFSIDNLKAAYEAGVKFREGEKTKCSNCGGEVDKIDVSYVEDHMKRRYLVQCTNRDCRYCEESIVAVEGK